MKTIKTLAILLCAMVQGAWAWDGGGTSANPYLIRTSADWKQLADNVSGGKRYSDTFFEMTADIDALGISVGSESRPFSGIFDGDGHTLTYNRGTEDAQNGVEAVDDYCAPFLRLDGATVRHLRVTGAVYSSHMHAAGIAALIDGSQETTIYDCHVSSRLVATQNLSNDASFGGIAGEVLSTCTATTEVNSCTFTGRLLGWATSSSGMVGFTNRPVKFEYCIFDPQELAEIGGTPATYARTAPGVTVTLKDCYYTKALGEVQGKGMFTEVTVPEGCTVQILGKPVKNLGGKDYYASGTQISLTVPEGTAFDHWVTSGPAVSCFISDPWTADGIHTLTDVRSQPVLGIATSMPEPVQKNRSRHGIVYRYLSNRDYLLFMSDSLRQARGYRFDSDGECFVYDGEGTKTYITVVWGCNPSDGTFQNYYREGWFFQSKNYEGCLIDNDLVADAWDHTHLFAIAPRAFKNVKELKRIIFLSDINPNFKGNAAIGLEVAVQEQAFMGSGIEELVMMYRNEKTKSWDILGAASGVTVAANAFEGTSGQIAVDPSVYQSYLSDKNWSAHQSRFSIYAAKVEDMKVSGAVYSYMRNNKGEALKNNDAGHNALMESLRYWNADYENFNAANLLSNCKQNIWYTQIVGCDDDYLRKNDGMMRIYNDPGSVYNYKTIAIGRNAFKGSKELKSIEFWQTNGRSENSYSDLKMVIQNGAFQDCTNLKEVRLFYYEQDGTDHWSALGPEDVIPSENIFGIKQYTDAELNDEKNINIDDTPRAPKDFKFLVSSDLYQDFLDDPNWQPYLGFLKPVDFTATPKKDIIKDGLTYGYMASPNGILQTSQVVSQDVSWWTVPRIAIEVALTAASLWTTFKPSTAALDAAKNANKEALKNYNLAGKALDKALGKQTYLKRLDAFLTTASTTLDKADLYEALTALSGKHVSEVFENTTNSLAINYMKSKGLIDKAGYFLSDIQRLTTEAIPRVQQAVSAMYLKTDIGEALANQVQRVVSLQQAYEQSRRAWMVTVNALLKEKDYYFVAPGHIAMSAGLVQDATLFALNCWGKSVAYNGDNLRKGMRANILSNIHQVGLVGAGYVITTPTKNIIYHIYLKDVPADKTDVTIYAGFDEDNNGNTSERTMTILPTTFRNHKSLKTVRFHSMEGQTGNAALPLLLTIPDSAFVGCDNLRELNLLLEDNEKGTRPLGPENFILAGDGIFAGLDSLNFHIVIDESRKQDFLDNASWAPLKRYFTYKSAKLVTQYNEYGGQYAYAYENNSIKREHKVSGHLVEHLIVTGGDSEFLSEHQGALKLCNDIGVYNNFQLDAVMPKAFMGNKKVRTVNFTDLKGTGAFGDVYTGLSMMLGDSCFANCRYLTSLDMLYLVTDGTNHIAPVRPDQVRVGTGILDGTNAKIKMMPEQVEWFMADSSWVQYKDRFQPCIIRPADEGIIKALKDMAYNDKAATGYDPSTWSGYIDLSLAMDRTFEWFDGKFRDQRDNIRSFAEFQYFEHIGLDYIGADWFRGCSKLTNIVLPKSLKTIEDHAFASCSALQEIELPAALEKIEDGVFDGCKDLRIIIARGTTPARLTGNDQFPKNQGLRIYVPAEAVDAYKTAWANYKQYIVSDAGYKVNKVIKLDNAGTLAEKLGLYVEWSYSGAAAGDEPRYVHGNYAKYDSLTISGPLNNVDLYVIRYLAGNIGYDRGGNATDGRLRYLNLYNARIVKEKDEAHYVNLTWGINFAWQCIENNDELPPYLFHNCTALHTVILPRRLTSITHDIFEGCTALERVAITGSVEQYDGWQYSGKLLNYPLPELVFYTDDVATSTAKDPWGQEIGQIYTQKSQLGDYLSHTYLVSRCSSITTPFQDELIMKLLADKGEFFPSEYLAWESVEGIFVGRLVTDLADFSKFQKVKRLESTFHSCDRLKRITLPASVEYIGADAFKGCISLDTIRVIGIQPAELAENAFRSLPSTFRILVPRSYAKLYREKWAQYADHINADDIYTTDVDIITVTLTEPNTLGKALGLEVNYGLDQMVGEVVLQGVRGDYSRISRLKVIGPIGAIDIDLMKYLAGYVGWNEMRNYSGHLSYIDLYDADIKASYQYGNQTAVWGEYRRWDGTHNPYVYKVNDNELTKHAFLRAYSLQTLILPKTLKIVKERALQECEGLETLVLGDDMENFNWNALDDDAMLNRMYILAKKKVEISTESAIWRKLCNNYNPTFDAFYVRPSLYNDYLHDDAYTGASWQRTNNISKGAFGDDESFCAFAAHAAATMDDLASVTSVEGWFQNHPGAKDLTALKYTSIDSLKAATMAPLTQLERIALPMTLKGVDEGVFQKNTKLRYVDFLMSHDTELMSHLNVGTHRLLGTDEKRTLVYMPAEYGDVGGTNVIVDQKGKLTAFEYYLNDSLDYLVPYAFDALSIKNSRKLPATKVPYTVCLPYSMYLPRNTAKAYKLSQRDGNKLVFVEMSNEVELKALHPYLLLVNNDKDAQGITFSLDSYKYGAGQPIPASAGIRLEQDDAPGYSLRGSFRHISNSEAADLGAYVLRDDGEWHPVTTANTKGEILPFRAYLLPSARNAGARISMTLTDDDTTGIDTIETIGRDGTHRYYDLNGRQIDPASAKGVVIKDGRKVVIK